MRRLLLAAAILAGVLAIHIAAFVFAFVSFVVHCDRSETVLATDAQGRSVVSLFSACTSIGTTVDETIELRSPSGRRTTFFRFAPNPGIVGCRELPGVEIPQSEATVKWGADGAIHLAIGGLSAIDEKLDVVDGIPVKYNIGIVIHDKCK